jgi:hypothetical protein
MVSDPRISVAQAAQILGKTRAQVYGLVTLGRLRRRGEPNKFRGLLLSDVLQCRDRGDLMKVTDAAKLLGGTANDVRRLIAEGKLTLVPGSQRLVYETDVRELSRTWTRPGPCQAAPAQWAERARRYLGGGADSRRSLTAAVLFRRLPASLGG